MLRVRGVNPVEKLEGEHNKIYLNFKREQTEELENMIGQMLKYEKEVKLKDKTIKEKITYYEKEENTIKLDYSNFSYQECMRRLLPEDSAKDAPKSFETIGSVAHLNIRDDYLPLKKLVGKIILDKNPIIKTVVNKVSKIDNVYRTYDMEVISGEESFEVNHKEVNSSFHFDVRKVYWSSRLQAERDRLLKKFKKDEILADAFCGVGPLAIRAARNKVKVYGNDLNPDCYKYLVENTKINKVTNCLFPYNMDARDFIRCMINGAKVIKDDKLNFDNTFPENIKVNHIHMNLPKDAIEFLDVFIGLFKGTSTDFYTKESLPHVHVYAFSGSLDAKKELLDRCALAMGISSFPEEYLLDFHNVRDISTRKYVFCISFMVPPEVAYK